MPADHMSCQPPRSPYSRVHFGQDIHVPPEEPEAGSIMGTDKMIVGDNRETNPVTIKGKTESRVASSSPGFPYATALPLGTPSR